MRKYSAEDIDSLKEMISDFLDEMGEKSKDEVYGKLLKPNKQISLLRDDREIVGFIVYKYQGDVVSITALGVAKGHRRKGYGKSLMELFLNQMSLNRSIKSVKLGVMKSKVPAMALYEKIGFRTIFEGVEDGIAFKTMQLDLTGKKQYKPWVV